MASSSTGSGSVGGLRRPGVMKGKVKAPKKMGPEVPPEEMWNRLAHAIEQIQQRNVSRLSYEEHYRYGYSLVLHNHGALLYEGVKRKIQQHLNQQCHEVIIPAFPPGHVPNTVYGVPVPPSLLDIFGPAYELGVSASAASSKGKEKALEEIIERLPVGSQGLNSGADKTDAAVQSQHAERLLESTKAVWGDHCTSVLKIREVLRYPDRVYVPQHKVASFWDLGLELFRDSVLVSPDSFIGIQLFFTLLMQIQIERRGLAINRSVYKANIDMLLALTDSMSSGVAGPRPTVYKTLFEPAFLLASKVFYQAEALQYLESNDAKAYLRHVERRLSEEESRVAGLLAPMTDAPLRTLLEKHLLANHLKTVLDMPGTGIESMLEADLRDDLRRLYKLFWRVQPAGPREFKAALKAYVGKRGREINAAALDATKEGSAATDGDAGEAAASAPKDSAGPASSPQAALALKWVENVLAFKVRFDEMLAVSFDGDKSVETVLNESFETFINTNPRAPEFISLFIDENLKKGLKGKTEAEVDVVLNQTITVFRFLHEKDVFERYYKSHLAKRLLNGRSVSDDAERGMMAKLKVESGHGYVQKLQGMLNDLKVSEDTSDAFDTFVKKTSRPMPFALSVTVLTSTYWPMPSRVNPCTMPPIMMSARQAYENFYQSRHSGRILSWHPNLGSADVRANFKSRSHDLNVSTYALVVLLLFQEEPGKLTYSAIKAQTNMEDVELKRTLQSLACSKYKILIKEPRGREVNEADTFHYNEGFTCPLARIRIATVAARVESVAERKETNEKVEEERKTQVEASIVRVMKDRKVMNHNELVNEVINQLAGRFSPSPATIKQRIESLIDREYLERKEGERNVYNYLA